MQSSWVESAQVTEDDTALWEWNSEGGVLVLPGPGAEPLVLVGTLPANKSQVLESDVCKGQVLLEQCADQVTQ